MSSIKLEELSLKQLEHEYRISNKKINQLKKKFIHNIKGALSYDKSFNGDFIEHLKQSTSSLNQHINNSPIGSELKMEIDNLDKISNELIKRKKELFSTLSEEKFPLDKLSAIESFVTSLGRNQGKIDSILDIYEPKIEKTQLPESLHNEEEIGNSVHFNISTRAYKVLQRARIHTVGDMLSFLKEYPLEGLRGYRNCGSKTISEIRSELVKNGIIIE